MAAEEQITSNYDGIIEALKLIVSGGIGAAIIGIIGKLVVDRKLQQQKAEYNKLFNRVTKIHEKEFEVLPEAWFKMQDALGRISSLVSRITLRPDLDRMGEAALEEFMAKSKLYEHEKKELRESPNKLDYYQKTIFWHDSHEAQQAFQDFHNYIIRNQIFLTSKLQEQFMKLDDIMWSAIVYRKEGEGGKDSASREMRMSAYKQIRDDVEPIRDEIADLLQKRLHYHDAD
ncbi:MAG: hypothetical protein FVQ80_02605 [Planctomycetes bacterium]|nr:hypothetical protein [Planctomycetota bacterium]